MLRKAVAIIGLGLALGAGSATAEPKPQGARNAPPQTVANFLAGKTSHWKDCKGGVYYGGNWEAQAWCEKDGPAVGIGKWIVRSDGSVCHELTWYWAQGDGYGSKLTKAGPQECDDHLVAPDGTLLRRWQGTKSDLNAWWRPANSDSIETGFKHKRKITQLRKKLGV